MEPTNANIVVENVSKTVGDQTILESVSFAVAEGELVSLIGPNGAGKSTLVKIILGLDNDYTGTVTLRSKDRVQYIPQLNTNDAYQLPISVYEYLRIGTTRLYRRRSHRVDFAATLQHVGVDPAKLQQSWYSVSGGERQRIAIARALLAEPSLLILDEPLAAVDYASRHGLYELIRHLQQDHGITVLLVSHDIESVVPLSDRVLCLNRTLHTDCHPTAFTGAAGYEAAFPVPVHHHC